MLFFFNIYKEREMFSRNKEFQMLFLLFQLRCMPPFSKNNCEFHLVCTQYLFFHPGELQWVLLCDIILKAARTPLPSCLL